MEETISPYSGQQQKSNKILPTIVVVGVLVAAFAGWFFVTQPLKTDKTDKKVEDVVVEKVEVSPTEKPKIEKTSVKIQVINGTGTPGQAGVVVTALEDAGYNSENIKTSNADKYDNTITSITARSNFEEIVNDMKNVLKSTFDKITVVSPNLDEASEFDVVIVTGGEIFEAVTPTTPVADSESPTPSITITPTSNPTPTP